MNWEARGPPTDTAAPERSGGCATRPHGLSLERSSKISTGAKKLDFFNVKFYDV